MSAEARVEMAAYVAEQFFAWDEMREQRDEARVRADELERQRDQARDWAITLEQENAELTRQIEAVRNLKVWYLRSGGGAIVFKRDLDAVFLTDSGTR